MRLIYGILFTSLLVSVISLGMGCIMLASVGIIIVIASTAEGERIEATSG